MKEESGLFNFGIEGIRMEAAFPCNNESTQKKKTNQNNIYGLVLFSLKCVVDIQVEKFSGSLI